MTRIAFPSVFVALLSLGCAGSASAGKCCWKRWGKVQANACGGYPSGASGGLCNTDYFTKCHSATTSCGDVPPSPPPSPPSPPSPAPPPVPTPTPSTNPAQVHKDEVFGVKMTRDVTYAQGLARCSDRYTASACTAMDLKLDIYEPSSRSAGTPVPALKPAYVMMHGGGNTGGAKGGLNILPARWLAARGFVVFDINYRLSGDKGLLPTKQSTDLQEWKPQWASLYPATRDAKAAIRFVRANAVKYGIDVSRVASTGGSAGATDMLAGGVAFEEDYKNEMTEAQDPTLSSTNMNFSSAVQCLVLHWPSDGGVLLVNEHYPARGDRYRSVNPPVISFHGDKDTTIPIEHSYAIQKAYKQTGASFDLHVLKGCPHGAWCYDGKGKCTCGGDSNGPRSFVMEELALPVMVKALNLTLVGGMDVVVV